LPPSGDALAQSNARRNLFILLSFVLDARKGKKKRRRRRETPGSLDDWLVPAGYQYLYAPVLL